MTVLGLSQSAIKAIIDDPTILGDRLSASSSSKLGSLGITPSMADDILNGYTHGFRTVFVMNASLAAVATIASVLMIRHKELSRGDEDRLRAAAKVEEKHMSVVSEEGTMQDDIELGIVQLDVEERIEL